MAEGSEKKAYIIHVHYPEGEDREAFNIRTLASAVGSDSAAKESVCYHYKDVISGFSAELTSKEAEELSKQPAVFGINPSETYVTCDNE